MKSRINMAEARHKKDLSVLVLGEMVGVHRNYIQMIESARRKPSKELAEKLSNILEIPVEKLLENKEGKFVPPMNKNKYEVRGDTTILFATYKGEKIEAMISTKRLQEVIDFPGTWYGSESGINRNGSFVYIVANTTHEDGSRTRTKLHRFLMDASDEIQVDHISGNTLDCRDHNLRFATPQQNSTNKSRTRFDNLSSGEQGVTKKVYRDGSVKWQTTVCLNGKKYSLGAYKNKNVAQTVVKEARSLLFPFSKEARTVKEIKILNVIRLRRFMTGLEQHELARMLEMPAPTYSLHERKGTFREDIRKKIDRLLVPITSG